MHHPAPRRPRRLTGAALTLLVGGTALGACGRDEPDARSDAEDADVVEVVEVSAQPCDRPNRARGVGVVVGDELVATAAHTVDGELRALEVDGRAARVVVVDARTDLALLRAPVEVRPVDWADLDTSPLGPAVVHLADGPHDVEVVRSGPLIVNDVTDHARHERDVHTFTPGVARGASGAPLTTPAGRLLGIVALDRTDTEEAHATAAHELRRLVDEHAARVPQRAPTCHD